MPKERLIIVGGGGFGRELMSWAADCHEAGTLPELGGVIDDDATILDGYRPPVGVIGSVSDFQPGATDRLVTAIGNPGTKRRVVEMLAGRGGQFVSLIHPSAVIARSASMGEGAVFCPLSMASADAKIGRFVIVNTLSSVGHDARVGDFSTLSAHVDLTGFVALGDGVMVGSGAKVVPRVKIGDAATIGAGSTVYRNVAAGTTVFAPPAKVMART